MPEFLKLKSVSDSLAILRANLPESHPESETIETKYALGRVLNKDLISDESLPAFNRSSVDGYAVKAADTHGASDFLPAYLKSVGEVRMGTPPEAVITTGNTMLIHTGGMLPVGADAVVMLENTNDHGTGEIEVYRAVSVNENILCKGEDVKPGDILISGGRRIRPEEIGGLAAIGKIKVSVNRMPAVSIISTGDEVVDPAISPQPGQVRDINSYTLASLVQLFGGRALTYPIVPDNPVSLFNQVKDVMNCSDMVVITAGSSASSRDMTAEVIHRLGKPGILVHGINIRPGKPTILAVCDGKAIIGLPGNPVSALVIARLFLKEVIDHLSGIREPGFDIPIRAELTINLTSQAGRDEYYPVQLLNDGKILKAEPIFFKSNLIFGLVRANGLLHIPADATGFSAGSMVDVILI